jgi:hypothetical protein
MYNKIILFLLNCYDLIPTILPWFFYGLNRCGKFSESDMIVLENVKYLEFRISQKRLLLDNAIQA